MALRLQPLAVAGTQEWPGDSRPRRDAVTPVQVRPAREVAAAATGRAPLDEHLRLPAAQHVHARPAAVVRLLADPHGDAYKHHVLWHQGQRARTSPPGLHQDLHRLTGHIAGERLHSAADKHHDHRHLPQLEDEK